MFVFLFFERIITLKTEKLRGIYMCVCVCYSIVLDAANLLVVTFVNFEGKSNTLSKGNDNNNSSRQPGQRATVME